ncbi:hypothetical protein PanWU01x14_289170 [Parasponia andersonii]|uniref:Uncharacterized protein n=1 Tax=Parasponia andersonii TaxID=3476 RepID=A0A2P5AY37_PARAD|nr:hypothetical protein PanWU01x14_289170 [Parasponia andersonii]
MGLCSKLGPNFWSERATESEDEILIVIFEVEKKSMEKATMAKRAMHVTRKRKTKTMAVAMDFREEDG